MPERKIVAKLANNFGAETKIEYYSIFLKEEGCVEPLGTYRSGENVCLPPKWFPIDHHMHKLPVPETVHQMMLEIKKRFAEEDQYHKDSLG